MAGLSVNKKKVLLVGYGSIGKRHARNLLGLGVRPYVLTGHPDGLDAVFFKNVKLVKDKGIEYCIIASPTSRHLNDVKSCLGSLKAVKKILIEKPLEDSHSKAQELIRILKSEKVRGFVAYNLRFIKAFRPIGSFLKKQKNNIRIVEATAGQDLALWRPGSDIRSSYSARRSKGGGVDLDLSHEIDYILWLFGDKFKNKMMFRSRIGNRTVNSPDIFKLFMDYRRFVVDITLDYIRRPKQRYLKIICEDAESLHYDFNSGALKIGKRLAFTGSDLDASYKRMLRAFLDIDKRYRANLCSVNEGLSVLKVLEV